MREVPGTYMGGSQGARCLALAILSVLAVAAVMRREALVCDGLHAARRTDAVALNRATATCRTAWGRRAIGLDGIALNPSIRRVAVGSRGAASARARTRNARRWWIVASPTYSAATLQNRLLPVIWELQIRQADGASLWLGKTGRAQIYGGRRNSREGQSYADGEKLASGNRSLL